MVEENVSSVKTPCCAIVQEHTFGSTLPGSLVRSRAKLWLATCKYLYFLASDLVYDKIWTKGQRFMKSRQEVILKVIECIDLHEIVWT